MKKSWVLIAAALVVASAAALAPTPARADGCGGTYIPVIKSDGTKGRRCLSGCNTNCTCIASETCPDAIKPYPE
jgi:hypothetical protein